MQIRENVAENSWLDMFDERIAATFQHRKIENEKFMSVITNTQDILKDQISESFNMAVFAMIRWKIYNWIKMEAVPATFAY